MVRVSVKMFATVREASGVPSAEVEASDMAELLSSLCKKYGRRFTELVDRARSDPEGLVILLNGKNIGRGRLSSHRLSSGDEVAIFPPVSGG